MSKVIENRAGIDVLFLRELPKEWPAVREVWVYAGTEPRSIWKCVATRNRGMRAEAVSVPPSPEHPGGVRIALLPARATLLRRVDAPFASERKSRELLPFLLDAEIPFPIESACYAFERPDEKLAALEGLSANARMGVAALQDDVARFHLELARDKVQADVLDAESLAMWEMLPAPTAPHPRRILLWIEPSRIVAMRGIAFPEDIAVWSRDAAHASLESLQSRWWRWLQSMPVERRTGIHIHVYSTEATSHQDLEALGGETLLPHATWSFETSPLQTLAEAVAVRFQRRRTINLSLPEHVPSRVHDWLEQRQRRRMWGIAFWAGLPLCLALITAGFARWNNHRVEKEITRIATTFTGEGAIQISMAPLLASRAMEDILAQAHRIEHLLNHPVAALWTTVQQTALSNGIILQRIELSPARLIITGSVGARSAATTLEQIVTEAGFSCQLELTGSEQNGFQFTLAGEGKP